MRAEVVIDIKALRHNLMRVRKLVCGRKIMAMVKGNAYGHGMSTIASYLRDVDYLGVACVDAAIALRHSGVIQPIVLIGGFQSKEELKILLEHKVQLVIYQWQQINLLQASDFKGELEVWLKLDTGMRRLGFEPEYVEQAEAALKKIKQIKTINWMTHFACADEKNSKLVQNQNKLFLQLTKDKSGLKSTSNSAAILQYNETCLDVVRPGIMLYGVSPRQSGIDVKDDLKPVMTFKARIMEVHELREGEYVGYGAKWRAKRPSKIAVVAAGYGDGYPQHAKTGTPVLVNGNKTELIGQVSMDSLTIDITDLPDAKLDDWVTLWGKGLPVEAVAKSLDVSPYALLAGITARPRHKVAGV